jgi:hypothetical protein
MSRSTEIAPHETWENPTNIRNPITTLAQGIALTATFTITLLKRAYTPTHPTPQHSTTTTPTTLNSAPSH